MSHAPGQAERTLDNTVGSAPTARFVRRPGRPGALDIVGTYVVETARAEGTKSAEQTQSAQPAQTTETLASTLLAQGWMLDESADPVLSCYYDATGALATGPLVQEFTASRLGSKRGGLWTRAEAATFVAQATETLVRAGVTDIEVVDAPLEVDDDPFEHATDSLDRAR